MTQRVNPLYHSVSFTFALCWALLPSLLAAPFILSAAEEEFDDFGGFSDVGETESTSSEPWLRGSLSLDLARQIGAPNRWVRNGVSTQLILDRETPIGHLYAEATGLYNAAYRLEKDPQAIIDRYEVDGLLREFYWQKAFAQFSLSVGRKMLVWGKADLLPVVNMITPQDRSAALFAKPEETRLGQDLIQLDWYGNGQQLNAVLIPQPQFNLQVNSGHPYATLFSDSTDRIKDNDVEYGLRWNQQLPRAELALIAGHFANRDPLFDGFEQTHRASDVLALSYNRAADPFLFKTELAYLPRHPTQIFSPQEKPQIEEKESYRAMLGVDYVSQNYGSWITELYAEWPSVNYPGSSAKTSFGLLAINWSERYWRDDLLLGATVMFFSDLENRVVHLSSRYQYDDRWSVSGQYSRIDANGDSFLLTPLEGFDRLDFSLSYTF
ncbi:MAG: hypothetical protein Q9O24_10685 [Gammaproteobacteria bacterium]|nr:hypothetical protein [Gammaproteobacteria bacterium]